MVVTSKGCISWREVPLEGPAGLAERAYEEIQDYARRNWAGSKFTGNQHGRKPTYCPRDENLEVSVGLVQESLPENQRRLRIFLFADASAPIGGHLVSLSFNDVQAVLEEKCPTYAELVELSRGQ